LWTVENPTESDGYKNVALINKARQATQAWNYDYVERYVLENFFSYSFGEMLVILTNSLDDQDVQMPYLPWSEGTRVCNIFWQGDSCQTVTSDGFHAHTYNGGS